VGSTSVRVQGLGTTPAELPGLDSGSASSQKLVVLGAIIRPHGINGELRVKLFNPESEILLQRQEFIACTEVETRAIRIVRSRPHGKGFAILRIDGCHSKEDAETLRGAQLCLPRERLPELEKDEYYYSDLVGLVAVLPSGDQVGKILEVISYPAADVLLVRSAEGLLEVPMHPPYLVTVHVAEGCVVIDRIEDLVRLNPKRERETS
jgi:16S rRNA processing protein RimM